MAFERMNTGIVDNVYTCYTIGLGMVSGIPAFNRIARERRCVDRIRYR